MRFLLTFVYPRNLGDQEPSLILWTCDTVIEVCQVIHHVIHIVSVFNINITPIAYIIHCKHFIGVVNSFS